MLTTNVTSLELLESYQCGLEVSFRKRPARARPTAAAATGWTALGGNGATELALISQSTYGLSLALLRARNRKSASQRSGRSWSAIDSKLCISGIQRSSIALRKAATRVTSSDEHTSELQSLMRISYAVFCLKKNQNT